MLSFCEYKQFHKSFTIGIFNLIWLSWSMYSFDFQNSKKCLKGITVPSVPLEHTPKPDLGNSSQKRDIKQWTQLRMMGDVIKSSERQGRHITGYSSSPSKEAMKDAWVECGGMGRMQRRRWASRRTETRAGCEQLDHRSHCVTMGEGEQAGIQRQEWAVSSWNTVHTM